MAHSLRARLKGTAEWALITTGVAARARRRLKGRASVVAYHNVVTERSTSLGDVSLHLGLDDFCAQLERLAETFRVLPLSELPTGSGSDEPVAAITFDDGYRGVARHAVPELVLRGLPATVFVCPGLLGEDGFWWDRIADPVDGVSEEDRNRAMEAFGGRHHEVLDEFPSRPVPDDLKPMNEQELLELASQPGISIASHTWSHVNLTKLVGGELQSELERSLAWLEARVPDAFVRDHLSFPYGLWNEDVASAAREAGHRFLYRVEGGTGSMTPEGGVLPRINIPAGASVRGFELRVAGFVP